MRRAGMMIAVAATLLLGCPPVHAPPGDEGDSCSTANPCASGLTCSDGQCVRIVADAGTTDALIGDLAGRDLVGWDLATADAVATDQALADHASGDGQTGVDQRMADGPRPDGPRPDGMGGDGNRPDGAGPLDQGWLPDGVSLPDGWTLPDGVSLPDGWTMPDGVSLPDGWTMPDIAGADLWFLQPDADLSESGLGFDAAVAEYTGTAEDGVVCAATLCGNDASCCIAPISTSLYCDDSQPFCGQYELAMECDGAEDCGAGEECCSRNLSTFCIAEGTCYAQSSNNVLICVDSSDCTHGFVCCASGSLATYGIEIGWCQANCS